VVTGIADAIAVAREAAGDRDVGLMGSGVIRAAVPARGLAGRPAPAVGRSRARRDPPALRHPEVMEPAK
jgi:hypothetical protein